VDSDLIPARMVNEFVYCPRLFYLEWVEDRFAESDDTRLGKQVHRRVDVETGAAPLPEQGDLRTARSVTVSSDSLGVIAKVDLNPWRRRYRRSGRLQERSPAGRRDTVAG
jgi:CRISP-associated protein Cas1